jgi:hypothetical protein
MSEVVVRFRGDTRQLDRALRGINRGLDRVERNAKQSNRALKSISATGDRVTTALRAAGAALIAFGAGSVIKGIVTTTARFEDLRTTLASVTGGAQQGAEAFKFISEFATKTQFGVEDLTTSFIKLKASGIEPTEELLTLFTDAAAVTTDQIGSLQAITDLFARTTAGGLGLEELNRLADRGIPVFTILQEKLGRNRLELSDLGKTAEGANEILTALSEGIRERFGGATENRINNVSTQFSNLQIAITNAADAIGSQGFALALGQTAVQITEFITNNEAMVKSIGEGLTYAFLYAKETAYALIQNIELLGKAMAVVIGIAMGRWAIGVGTAMAGLAMTVGGGVVKAFGFLGKVLRATAILAARHPLIGAVALVIGGIEYLTGAVSGLAEKLGLIGEDSALDQLVDDAGKLASTISGPVVKGLEDFSGIQDRVNQQFNDIQSTLEKQADVTQPKITQEVEKQDAALQRQATTVKDILDSKFEELRISQLSTSEQQRFNLEKEIQQKVGRELTADEKERLGLLVKQTQQIRDQEKAFEQLKQAMDKGMAFEERAIGLTRIGADTPLGDLETAYDLAKQQQDNYLRNAMISEAKHKQNLMDLERQFQIEKARIQQKAVENNIRNMFREGEALKSLYNFQVSAGDKAVLQRIGQEEKVERMVADRIEFEKKSEYEKYQWAVSQGASAFEALGRYNKQAFEASKALRIAEAIMNTYTGATLALATYPPPFNFIGAAAVVAAGLANIATIRSQSYQGRQLGGPVAQGETYMVGEAGPELFTPSTSGRIDRMDSLGGSPVEITFNINAVDAASVDELLIQRKGTIQQVISDAMLERGQRSRF